MAVNIFKRKVKKEPTLQEQVEDALKNVLLDGVKRDRTNEADLISLNLTTVLNDQKERLGRMFENDFEGFKNFLTTCVSVVQKYYIDYRQNISSTAVDLRDAIREEARDTVKGFNLGITGFVKVVSMEKIEQIEKEKNKKAENIQKDLKETEKASETEKGNELVSLFVNKYLQVSTDAAKSDKTAFKTMRETYNAVTIAQIIAENGDQFNEFRALFDAMDPDGKAKFASDVQEQIRNFETKNVYTTEPVDREKPFIMEVNEKAEKINELNTKKTEKQNEFDKVKSTLESIIDNIAAKAGKEDDMNAKKTADIKDAITFAATLTEEPKDLYDLAKISAAYSIANDELTLINEKIKVAELEKKIAELKREGFKKFMEYDVAEKARPTFETGRDLT